jgi:hypothetical protein
MCVIAGPSFGDRSRPLTTVWIAPAARNVRTARETNNDPVGRASCAAKRGMAL